MTPQLALGIAGSKRFELVRHLGSGGMGSVFEAIDRERRGRVALKTLQRPSADALLYLKNEFRALQDVRHENLAQLLELVEEDGRFFVVMELIVGSDLLNYLRPGEVLAGSSGVSETRLVTRNEPQADLRGPTTVSDDRPFAVDEQRLRRALSQLATALLVLHDHGKVHRDVKPSNVLVTEGGRVVLVDFGLTLDLDSESARLETSAIGTRAFMAPEQAAGQVVNSAADWYSFGVVLFLALTGSLPFRGAQQERQKLGPVRVSARELNPDAAEDLALLASELLDSDPSRRPDGRAVLLRLDAAAPQPVKGLSSPFLGREQELSELGAAFAESRERRVLSLVVGDSGLGKSALAREFLTRVGQSEPRTLRLVGRCYEREWVPYKAFDGIIDDLSRFLRELSPLEAERLIPDSARLLTRVFPVLGRVPRLRGDVADVALEPQAMRGMAFLALRALFTRLAEDRPVLLYIDDLQWADGDSHLLLSDLLREPAPRLQLLATTRPVGDGPSVPLTRLCTELGAGARRLVLTPLPPEPCRALARHVLGSERDSELSVAIAGEAAGQPLFVQALAEHARDSGVTQFSALRLEDALLARIERLGARERRLLELVSVAGAPLATTIASHASELQAVDCAASVASLRVAHLVRASAGGDAQERIEPYHDRIRETVLERLESDARRLHHHDLAEAMQANGSVALDPRALVRHLEGAERHLEAATQAKLAAEQADQALAFEQASELYGTALRLGRFEPELTQQLRVALAEALTNAGQAVGAGRAYLTAAESAQPTERLEYRRRAADHLLRSGHLEEGSGVLSDVLREFGTDLGTQRRALFKMLSGRALLALRGLSWRARAASEVPLEQQRRIEAYHAVGVSFALIDTVRGASFEVQALRLALEAGEPMLLAATLIMQAGYEGASGARGLKRSGRLLVEVDRIIAQTPDPYVVAARRMIQGFLDYHAGHFQQAAHNLAAMEHTFSTLPGCYFERAFCHCFRLICLRNSGQIADLLAGFDDWVRAAERRGDRFTEASLRFNLNGVWLARNQPDEALRDLERVSWIPPDNGYHVQHWYEQQARVEIALYTGRTREGLAHFRGQLQALSRSFLLRMRLHRCHAQWLLGRLLLAEADANPGGLARESQRELATLVKRLGREQLGTAQTWASLLQAGLLHHLGHRKPAIDALEQARARAREYGLPHCEWAAAFRLGRELAGTEGGELAGEAIAWARAQGVQLPERLFESWAPGFG